MIISYLSVLKNCPRIRRQIANGVTILEISKTKNISEEEIHKLID